MSEGEGKSAVVRKLADRLAKGVPESAVQLFMDAMTTTGESGETCLLDYAEETVNARETVDEWRGFGPGKFEGSPIYAPFMHAVVMDGGAEEASDEEIDEMRSLAGLPKLPAREPVPDDDGSCGDLTPPCDVVQVTDDMRSLFPDLKGVGRVALEEDENGFVHCLEVPETAPEAKNEAKPRKKKSPSLGM